MTIPFTKAHGAHNDFLLTWTTDAPSTGLTEAAVAICDRHTGPGADGWLLVSREAPDGCHGAIRLINSDGSEAEISGNGTRCAAAFLVEAGCAKDEVRIATGAGVKYLRLLNRQDRLFEFFMNMGRPEVKPDEVSYSLVTSAGSFDVTILNVGNPQCAVFVDELPVDWRAIGSEIEHHRKFARRTNVSFVQPADPHTIRVHFWERGAGETMSSGTGSTGAAAAAIFRGVAASPVTVLTPAGSLTVTWECEDVHMTGPAEIVARGEFYWSQLRS
jgi:diaminopimelate epimerase